MVNTCLLTFIYMIMVIAAEVGAIAAVDPGPDPAVDPDPSLRARTGTASKST